jgi:hypothetical protein
MLKKKKDASGALKAKRVLRGYFFFSFCGTGV